MYLWHKKVLIWRDKQASTGALPCFLHRQARQLGVWIGKLAWICGEYASNSSPQLEWTLGSNTYTLPTLHQVNNLNKDSEYICESRQYCFAESSSIFTFLLYVVTIVTSYPFSIVWCFEPYKLNVYFLNVFFCHYPLNSWSHPPLSHHAQVWHSCSHGDIWKRQRLYYQQVLSLLIILVCLNGWWSEGFWIICSG